MPKLPARKALPKEPVDQRVSLATAVEYTQRYRKAAPASEHAGLFYADGIAAVLAQPGVTAMRIYHGLDAEGRYRMVIVGVDAAGNDVVKAPAGAKGTKATKAKMAASASGEAVLLDVHLPCPPYCPIDSPLN